MKIYLLVANGGYMSAYISYEKAFEAFLDMKIEEIENAIPEDQRDQKLDNELLAVDQMHYEDVINADQILTDWGWKIVEMNVEL